MNYFSSAGFTLLLVAAIVYVAIRIYRILPVQKWLKTTLTVVYSVAAVFFTLSVTGCLDLLPLSLASFIYIFGNSWFIFFFYALIIFLTMEVLRFFGILKKEVMRRNVVGSAVIFGIIAALMICGAINYRHKYREEISISTVKVERPVKIVMMSDLHIGYHNRRAELARWIDMVNAEKPDIFLIAGDIIDRSARAVYDEGDAAEFHRLNAPVYACLGNHEYYAGRDSSIQFYREAGINLLIDSAVTVCGITIIGRDDSVNEERCSAEDLTRHTDPTSYRILLTHKPDTLSQACRAGVDLQLSGHTHGGQIWPVTWLVSIQDELAHGYKEKDGTRFYVSSGIGIWGGRFRIGSRSEYLVLNLVPVAPPSFRQAAENTP
ncbi:MAG: metallophosphoesterase [Bacteroidales bacterium]|nr:metallophosphoesterase [Bacteroidales bacterium]